MQVIRLKVLNQMGTVIALDRLLTGLCNTLLQPGFHFAFKPAGASAQLNRLWELTVLYELIEPFVG